MPAVEYLEFPDQRPGHLRAVAVEHAGVVGIEQRVFDAGKAGALAALDHHGVLRPRHVEDRHRSEEHTSELQSLMRNSYAVFCLKKKKKPTTIITRKYHNHSPN